MVVIFEQTDGELRKLRVLMRVKLAVSRIEYKLLFGAARSQNLTTVLLPLIHRRRLPPPPNGIRLIQILVSSFEDFLQRKIRSNKSCLSRGSDSIKS